MNLSIKELNELIYSLGITAAKGMMCDKELNVSLLNKVYDELNRKIAEEDAEEYIQKVLREENQRAESLGLTFNRGRGMITQALLDYVDDKGAVSHKELESFYKSITGSNSFSHILDNLRTPYRNRKTQRYVAKEGKRYSDAKYIIKVANPSNWVEIDY